MNATDRAVLDDDITLGDAPDTDLPIEGVDIPEVLLSGDHKRIDQWRKRMREETTRERRPDLWEAHLANQQAKGGPKTGKPKEK